MTMAYATLTGPITLPGSDIGVRARIIATPLTTDQLLTYTGDDRFTAGPVVGETNGVGALNGMKVPTNSDLPGLLWQITAERLDKGPGPAKWTIKHAVAITGTGTIKLRDLVEVDVLTVDSTLVASVSDLAAAADASKTAAAGSATTAAGWADAAASSAADADTSADLADTSADTATTAANTATTKATEASTSATTATTKASEAAASASHAEDMAGAAEAVAVSNDTIIAGRINDSASATAAALTASTDGRIDARGLVQPSADALILRRLDDLGTQACRRYSGQASIDYTDATIQTQDWSTLVGLVNSNVQVSGNKLYPNGTANPACVYIPLSTPITPGERFHLSTFFDVLAFPSSANIYIGLDALAPSDASNVAGQPDAISLGITATGNLSPIVGANLTAYVTSPGNTTTSTIWGSTPPAGRYSVSIDGDEKSVSMSLRLTTDNTKTFVWKFDVAALAAAGKTFGRIMVYNGDTRGTSGQACGPVAVIRASQQPSRTKTIASFQVEGTAHRDFAKTAVSSSDYWRLQLPANYDPRKPAPLALYLHAAQVGSTTAYDRPWGQANEQPLTKALGDAGYIVACAQDGYVVGSPNTDRYGNQASMDNWEDYYKWVRSHFAVGPVVLYGPSMGGLTGTNILARRTIPNIAAAYFICPSIDLDVPHSNPTYAGPIRAAFGVASDDSDYAAKTAGYNSMARAGWEFRGVPIRMVGVTDDTVAPPASHVDPFITKISPYVPEASKLTVASGGHLASAAYSASDLMSFLGRHVFV